MIPNPITNYYSLLAHGDENDDYSDDDTVAVSNVDLDRFQPAPMPSNISFPTCNVVKVDRSNPQPRTQIKPSHVTLPTRTMAWQSIIQANKLQQLPKADMAFNMARVTRSVKHAVSDSGATGHFLVEGAPVVNMRKATKPIQIMLPNGDSIKSTHTCHLDIPWLPAHMTEAHIVPGLSHSSLISTRKFCDAGCKVVFDAAECRVYYKDSLVLVGDRDPATHLWRLPINPRGNPTNSSAMATKMDLHLLPHQEANHSAFSVYTIPYRRNQLKYMHQSFFNIPIPTLLKAIDNEQLEGIPFMKADLVRKYLAKSPATSKGRMKRPRQGL